MTYIEQKIDFLVESAKAYCGTEATGSEVRQMIPCDVLELTGRLFAQRDWRLLKKAGSLLSIFPLLKRDSEGMFLEQADGGCLPFDPDRPQEGGDVIGGRFASPTASGYDSDKDGEKKMSQKERNAHAKTMLEGLRETLRNTAAFTCMCCQRTRPKGEAAGAHLYSTEDALLRKAMIDENGKERIGTYVLCLECVDSLSDDAIHRAVTQNFGKAGLFGNLI